MRVLLVVDEAVSEVDAQALAALHAEEGRDLEVEVLVPQPVAAEGRVVDLTVDRLRRAGTRCRARQVPSRAVAERVVTLADRVDEVAVLAPPHRVREALRIDLVSRTRKRVRVPVLRLTPHPDPQDRPAPGAPAARGS